MTAEEFNTLFDGLNPVMITEQPAPNSGGIYPLPTMGLIIRCAGGGARPNEVGIQVHGEQEIRWTPLEYVHHLNGGAFVVLLPSTQAGTQENARALGEWKQTPKLKLQIGKGIFPITEWKEERESPQFVRVSPNDEVVMGKPPGLKVSVTVYIDGLPENKLFTESMVRPTKDWVRDFILWKEGNVSQPFRGIVSKLLTRDGSRHIEIVMAIIPSDSVPKTPTSS